VDSTTNIILLLLILILYMLPTLLAFSREHPRRGAIGVANILIGWTLIGWVVVFLWAALGHVEEQPV